MHLSNFCMLVSEAVFAYAISLVVLIIDIVTKNNFSNILNNIDNKLISLYTVAALIGLARFGIRKICPPFHWSGMVWNRSAALKMTWYHRYLYSLVRWLEFRGQDYYWRFSFQICKKTFFWQIHLVWRFK